MRVKKGDKVFILSGKDRGKVATVDQSMPSKGMIIVSGVNVAKKHQKPIQANRIGGIVDKAMPIPVSKVALANSAGKPARVAFKKDGNSKVRIDAKTKEVFQ
jgi:large subunit ribosomal protein L24